MCLEGHTHPRAKEVIGSGFLSSLRNTNLFENNQRVGRSTKGCVEERGWECESGALKMSAICRKISFREKSTLRRFRRLTADFWGLRFAVQIGETLFRSGSWVAFQAFLSELKTSTAPAPARGWAILGALNGTPFRRADT